MLKNPLVVENIVKKVCPCALQLASSLLCTLRREVGLIIAKPGENQVERRRA
jgi:hypothetical protein